MVRIKNFFLILILLLTTSAYSVEIPEKHRIYNRTGSQCVWVSLETVARWNGIEELYNISKSPSCQTFAGPGQVRSLLKNKGVYFYDSIPPKSPSAYELLNWADKYDICCIIGLNYAHAVVLQELTDEYAIFIENARQGCPSVKISRERFDQIFDGWVVVIFVPLEKQ